MTRNILTSALIAATLLAPVARPLPALAGGSFGVTITAETPEGRHAISRFLKLYAAGTSGATVKQAGVGNAASVAQSGKGNTAVVSQQGDGHAATVTQRGRGHRLGVFQFGKGTEVDVAQSGKKGASLVFFGGW